MLKALFFNKNETAEALRKKSVLINIILCLSAMQTVSLITNMFVQPHNASRYFIILLSIYAAGFLAYQPARRGYIYLSSLVYVAFLLLLIFGVSWSGGGMRAHGMIIIPVTVMVAGLTLGRKAVWFFGIASTLAGLGFVIAEYYSLLPQTSPIGNTPLIYWIYYTVNIILVCFIQYLAVKELLNALNEAKTELELRKKSEEQLRLKNEQLTEIAFLQSHIVRKPIANILGVVNLINKDNPQDPDNIELILQLDFVVSELDAAVCEVVKNTSTLTQEHIFSNEKESYFRGTIR